MTNGVEFGITLKGRDDGTFSGVLKSGEDSVKKLGTSAKESFDQVGTGANAGREGIAKMAVESDRLVDAFKRVGHYGAFAFGLSEIKSGIAGLIETSTAMDRFNSSIAIATGSIQNASVEYDHVRQLSQRLGLEVMGTAQAYASFSAAARGTTLEGQKARDVFDSVAGVTAKMGLNGEQSSGVFLALSQMMSKGVVSAEEFRQQLGERLPIATEAGARAMKVSTAEFTNLLNSGKLLSEDFLPKFAKALDDMGGGNGPVNTLQASLNRLSNNWTEIKLGMADSAPLKGSADLLVSLTEHTDALAAALSGATAAGAAWGALKLGDAARLAIAGLLEKRAALVADQAATLAAAEAEVVRSSAEVAASRAGIVAAQQRAAANLGLAGSYAAVAEAETIATAASARHTVALEVQAAAQATVGASAGILRAGLLLLGGPIGAIALALGIGAAAWVAWGDHAVESLDKVDAATLRSQRQKLLVDVIQMKNSNLSGFYERDIRAAEDKMRAIDQQIERLSQKKEEVRPASANAGMDAEWKKLTQTKAQQQAEELAALTAHFHKLHDAQGVSNQRKLELEQEYQNGKAKIEEKYSKKSNSNSATATAGLDSIQRDDLKLAFEAAGFSSAAATEKVKLYEQELKNTHEVEKLRAAGHTKEADALAAKLARELDASRAYAEQSISLRGIIEAQKEADKAWKQAGDFLDQMRAKTQQSNEDQIFQASLIGKSAVEVARLNAENRARLEIEREFAALAKINEKNPGAADAGIVEVSKNSQGIISAAGDAAAAGAQANLAKQGMGMDAAATEQANYDQQLAALDAYEKQKTASAETYAKMREGIEQQHRSKLVQLAMAGLLSGQQLEKLDAAGKVQLASQLAQTLLGQAAQHNKTAFEALKVVKLAEAAMMLPSTVMKAYDAGMEAGGPAGPAVGAAYAAMALATQLANMNAIASASFGGSSGTASAGGGGAGAGSIPGQSTNSSVPFYSSQGGGAAPGSSQNQTQPTAHVSITIQALDPSTISDATKQQIANSLAAPLQQAFNRNAQQSLVMV